MRTNADRSAVKISSQPRLTHTAMISPQPRLARSTKNTDAVPHPPPFPRHASYDDRIQTQTFIPLSGCSAVGSARHLGACDRLMSRPPKARKISVFLAFSRFSAAVCFGKKTLTTDLTTYGFDSKNSISGCRVTVTHQFWELVQAGSTPVIPTKNQPKMRFFAPLSADFYYRKFFSKTS